MYSQTYRHIAEKISVKYHQVLFETALEIGIFNGLNPWHYGETGYI